MRIALRLLLLSFALVACSSTKPATPAPAENQPTGYYEAPGSGERVYYYDLDESLERYRDGDRGPYVVLLAASATSADREQLAAMKLVADEHNALGDSSLVFRLTGEQRDEVEKLAFVEQLRVLAPADRHDVARFAALSGPVAVAIDFFEDVDAARLKALGALLESWGATVTHLDRAAARVVIDAGRIALLVRTSDVRWVEPLASKL